MTPQQQHEYDEAVRLGHTEFISNIPMYHSNTRLLYDAVLAKMPDLVVREGDKQVGRWANNNDRLMMYRGISLAYANDPAQIVGSIGFDGDQFYVSSRLVQNARFSHWNSDHRIKKSKHMKNILKEALKVLLPTQIGEVIKESGELFLRQVRDIRMTAESKLSTHLINIRAVLQGELEHMISIGYVPKYAEVAEAMKYLVDSREEHMADSKYNPDASFVWIKPDRVEYQMKGQDPKKIGSVDELPEDIRGKLFVLMVTDIKRFVRDVGMKYDDNKFWVIL